MAMPSSAEEAIDMIVRLKYAKPLTKWILYWSALAIVLRFVVFRKRTNDFNNRVVSIIHAIVAIYFSAVCFTPEQHVDMFTKFKFEGVGGPNTEEMTLCMAVSLSYFLYDAFYCVIVGDLESVIHHLFTIGGLASGVLNGKSGVELVGCLFLMEVSNPSLHMRSLLREMGLKDTTFAALNDLFFALIFIVCRLVIGPPLVYMTVVCETNDYIVKAGGLGILVVSVMWGWKIIMMFFSKAKALLGLGKKSKSD